MKNTKGSFSLMKQMNTMLILNLIRQTGEISRIDIAKSTGLTAATVTNLTAELLEKRIIKEHSVGESTGGRKPVLLKINPNRFMIACAYISPDSVEFSVCDSNAVPVFNKVYLSDGKGLTPHNCAEFICTAIHDYENLFECEISGLGLGIHGIVDSQSGIIVNSPNLGWKNVEIKKFFEEKTGLNVFIDNDVRLMAKAEMWFGKKHPGDDFAFLYVGRGVGGAVVSGGRIDSGKRNCAGEIGHTVIDINGPVCECGKRGCLQAHVSEMAMLSKLKSYELEDSVLTLESTCDDIVDAYLTSGDLQAKKIIDEEMKYLAIGVSNMINTFDPGEVIIGSSIKDFDKIFEKKFHTDVDEMDIGYLMGKCNINFSTVGKSAVLKGSAVSVLTKIYENL